MGCAQEKLSGQFLFFKNVVRKGEEGGSDCTPFRMRSTLVVAVFWAAIASWAALCSGSAADGVTISICQADSFSCSKNCLVYAVPVSRCFHSTTVGISFSFACQFAEKCFESKVYAGAGCHAPSGLPPSVMQCGCHDGVRSVCGEHLIDMSQCATQNCSTECHLQATRLVNSCTDMPARGSGGVRSVAVRGFYPCSFVEVSEFYAEGCSSSPYSYRRVPSEACAELVSDGGNSFELSFTCRRADGQHLKGLSTDAINLIAATVKRRRPHLPS